MALLVHMPGLAFMTAVHLTWSLALLSVLFMGVVLGLVVSARPNGFVWQHFEYEPSPEMPAPATNVAHPVDEEAHVLVDR